MPRSAPFGYRNISYYEPVPRGHKIVLSRSALTLGTVSFQTCASALRIHLRCRLRLRRRVPRPCSVRQRSITTDSGIDAGGRFRGVYSSASGCDLVRVYCALSPEAYSAYHSDHTPMRSHREDRAVNDRLSWRWLLSHRTRKRSRLPHSRSAERLRQSKAKPGCAPTSSGYSF